MQWLSSIPWWMRVTAGVFLSTGVVLVLVGLSVDTTGWWAGHPFATNVLASLAGWLVGVPISVVVIAAVLDHARDYRTRGQVYGTAEVAVSEISWASGKMLDGRIQREDEARPGSATHSLDGTVGRMLEHVRALRAHEHEQDSGQADPVEYSEALRVVRLRVPEPRRWADLANEVAAAEFTLQRAVGLAEFNRLPFPELPLVSTLHDAVAALKEPLPDEEEARVMERASRAAAVYTTSHDLAEVLRVVRPRVYDAALLERGPTTRFKKSS